MIIDNMAAMNAAHNHTLKSSWPIRDKIVPHKCKANAAAVLNSSISIPRHVHLCSCNRTCVSISNRINNIFFTSKRFLFMCSSLLAVASAACSFGSWYLPYSNWLSERNCSLNCSSVLRALFMLERRVRNSSNLTTLAAVTFLPSVFYPLVFCLIRSSNRSIRGTKHSTKLLRSRIRACISFRRCFIISCSRSAFALTFRNTHKPLTIDR
uniref:Uncharacterized protein n=1 Tax=Glossina austeni TaxID=7395 RepID=A0A1A9VX24_GLOAU